MEKGSAWDWSGAEKEYERAIELNPNYATAHHWYALHLSTLGRLDEAMAEIQRAKELDPLSLIINLNVGIYLIRQRKYDQAIEELRKLVDMDPNYGGAHNFLANAYELKKMLGNLFPSGKRRSSLRETRSLRKRCSKVTPQQGTEVRCRAR